LAEHGFFVREMNSGWGEWVADGLPQHEHLDLGAGVVRCSCSFP
jgi:hypothetical protein